MNNTASDKTDILAHYGGVDAEWYLNRYPDVAQSGLDAAGHYAAWGHRLQRGISAAAPTGAGLGGLSAAVSRRPVVSYCIPVMDRLADIQATLAANLEANRAHAAQVEFILLSYEDDGQLSDWVRAGFSEDLRSGYLRLIVQPRLPIWHFGQAKNGFRGRLAGRFYSSLDGDNFVTGAETRQLLSVVKQLGDRFVFHHFSGQWGDGSSGRVTVPRLCYEKVGYDPRLMPRQFDEVDLILSVLAVWPGMQFCRYGAVSEELPGALDAASVQAYLRSAPRFADPLSFPLPARRDPVNPQGHDYAQEDRGLAAMQAMNEALSFLKNAPGSARRADWVGRLRQAARDWVALTDAPTLCRVLFGLAELPKDLPDPVHVTDGRSAMPAGPATILHMGTPAPQAGWRESGDYVLPLQVGHPMVESDLWRAGLTKIRAQI